MLPELVQGVFSGQDTTLIALGAKSKGESSISNYDACPLVRMCVGAKLMAHERVSQQRVYTRSTIWSLFVQGICGPLPFSLSGGPLRTGTVFDWLIVTDQYLLSDQSIYRILYIPLNLLSFEKHAGASTVDRLDWLYNNNIIGCSIDIDR